MKVLVLELSVTKLMREPMFPFRPKRRACGELTISATCLGFVETSPLPLVTAGRRGRLSVRRRRKWAVWGYFHKENTCLFHVSTHQKRLM